MKVSNWSIRVEVWEVTYAKLNGNGEEIGTSLLGDDITAGNTGEVDVAGLNEALFALDGANDLFGEAAIVSEKGFNV